MRSRHWRSIESGPAPCQPVFGDLRPCRGDYATLPACPRQCRVLPILLARLTGSAEATNLKLWAIAVRASVSWYGSCRRQHHSSLDPSRGQQRSCKGSKGFFEMTFLSSSPPSPAKFQFSDATVPSLISTIQLWPHVPTGMECLCGTRRRRSRSGLLTSRCFAPR